MALINCPECGRSVSDKAKACPDCAFPIANASPADTSPSGLVRIKMSPFISPKQGPIGTQVTLTNENGEILWEGNTGQTAEVLFNKATKVTIKYHGHMRCVGGEGSGVIDPLLGKKYNVQASAKMFRLILGLQRVDFIDTD